MKAQIIECVCSRKCSDHCRLSQSCKGWGCRLLTTPIDYLPSNDHERAVLFSKVYREAKKKGVLECPYFNSLDIDKYLEILKDLQQISYTSEQNMSEYLSLANF